MIKIKITYLLTIFFSILLLFIGHKVAVKDMTNFQNYSQEIVKAKVLTVLDREAGEIKSDNEDENGVSTLVIGDRIIFEAKITEGFKKGEVVKAIQSMNSFIQGSQKEVYKNAPILLIFTNDEWYFNGFNRINALLVLGGLFVFCLILFGGMKGVNTIISLSLTCSAIFIVLIPWILSGKNIYIMSIIVCIYVITMMILLVIGFNKKAIAAMAGCAAGVIIAGVIAVIMDKALYLTGIIDEHSRYLINLPGDININLNAIIFAGILIGAMGAIMDVAVSIASSLWEIKEKAKTVTFKELFRSGITIGRDIMGSMADTLILAYIGTSLTVVLILTVFSSSLLGLFNSEMMAVEILQAMAGSLGILFSMPLTALFCSVIYLKEKNKE